MATVNRSLFVSFLFADNPLSAVKELSFQRINQLYLQEVRVKDLIDRNGGIHLWTKIEKLGKFFSEFSLDYFSSEETKSILLLKKRIFQSEKEKFPFIVFEEIHHLALKTLNVNDRFCEKALAQVSHLNSFGLNYFLDDVLELKAMRFESGAFELFLSEVASRFMSCPDRFKKLLERFAIKSLNQDQFVSILLKAASSSNFEIVDLMLQMCFSNYEFFSDFDRDLQVRILSKVSSSVFSEVILHVDIEGLPEEFLGKGLIEAMSANNIKAAHLFAFHPKLEMTCKSSLKKAFILSAGFSDQALFLKLFDLLSKLGIEIEEGEVEKMFEKACSASNHAILDCFIGNGFCARDQSLKSFERCFTTACALNNLSVLERILAQDRAKELPRLTLERAFLNTSKSKNIKRRLDFFSSSEQEVKSASINIDAIELFLSFWQSTHEMDFLDQRVLDDLKEIAKQPGQKKLKTILDHHAKYFEGH